MDRSYEQKYLKYKQKYLQLQTGGRAQKLMVPDRLKKMAIDEIYFWGRQMADHALFLHLLFEEANLKSEALSHNQRWTAFMKRQFEDKGIIIETFDPKMPKKVKVSLTDDEANKLMNGFDYDGLFALLTKLRAFKQGALDALNAGKWLGWAYPSFVKHVLMELDAFQNRILGVQTQETDIKFYNEMSHDHVGFTDNLTDYTPNNMKLKDELRAVFKSMPTLNGTERQQYILLSIKYVQDIEKSATDVQDMIHKGTYQGIIHPALIDHVVREEQRANMKLSAIKPVGAI